jgi:uncharacterized membrane protein
MECAACGQALPDSAVFCPACGRAISEEEPVLGTTGGLRDNIAGALAYLTFIPALIFVFRPPFNQNRYIRFHSFQCLFLCIAVVVVAILLRLLSGLSFLIAALLSVVFLVGVVILWLVLLLKAFQGERFKLPLIGDLAETQANR